MVGVFDYFKLGVGDLLVEFFGKRQWIDRIFLPGDYKGGSFDFGQLVQNIEFFDLFTGLGIAA